MSLVSSDILHQVFKFFVSENQIVDGESLRVASLVCKQWRNIVNSKSLWSTSMGITECQESNDTDNSYSVHRSLHIKEEARDSNTVLLHASLIGFNNLKCYGKRFPDSESYFFVRERATGYKYLLSMSGDGKKNRSLIRDIYANHFEFKEEFLLRGNGNNIPKIFYPSQSCPMGISVWKGRVVRWYRSESETEANEMINQMSSNREIQLRHENEFNERETIFAYVSHLIDLEHSSSRDAKNDVAHYAQGRQHVVDWMVEISECFALGDRTIFQAMLLFDRFIKPQVRIVKTSNFQLVAGACLLIASKLNNVVVTEKDICFCCDNVFSVANILATEELILKQLEWKLASPCSIEFMLALLKILGIEKNTRTASICSYILELSLMCQATLTYPPSIAAAASMVLAFYCLRNDNMRTLWPEQLSKATGLELNDVAECSVRLSQEIEGFRLATDRLDMIHRRYSKPSRHNVTQALIPILTTKTTLMDYEELLRSRIQTSNS